MLLNVNLFNTISNQYVIDQGLHGVSSKQKSLICIISAIKN